MFLVPGAPGDLSGAIRYNRDVYTAWGRLAEMVRTGRPVERPEVHLGEDGERTRTFVLSMHGRALGIGRSVVPQLKLAGRKKLFDVGGGPGTYSVLIAQKPKLAPHIPRMKENLSGVLKVPVGVVGIKATTTEGMGFTGREEGISAAAVVLIE